MSVGAGLNINDHGSEPGPNGPRLLTWRQVMYQGNIPRQGTRAPTITTARRWTNDRCVVASFVLDRSAKSLSIKQSRKRTTMTTLFTALNGVHGRWSDCDDVVFHCVFISTPRRGRSTHRWTVSKSFAKAIAIVMTAPMDVMMMSRPSLLVPQVLPSCSCRHSHTKPFR